MKRNFKLILEYDGTHYHGWQRQPHDLTIQEVLEGALEKITRRKCVVYGAGRTDSGVHALNYAANFRCDTHLDAGVFVRALNSTLPKDIVCKESSLAPEDFHARKSAPQQDLRIPHHQRPHAPGGLPPIRLACAAAPGSGSHEPGCGTVRGNPRFFRL